MKILYAGHIDEGTNSCYRMKTLASLGHDVYPFNFGQYYYNRYINAFQFRYGIGPGIFQLNRDLVHLAISNMPDIVWVDKGIYMNTKTIQTLKKNTQAKIIHYNPDDPFGEYKIGWKIFMKSLPLYDLHFVPRPQNINEYKKAGAGKVVEYDRAFDPKIHHPVSLEQNENQYLVPVGFIGTFAEARAKSILYLIENGIPVAIYGNGWKNSRYANKLGKNIRSEGVYGSKYAKIISGMDIALHFLRKENRDYQDSRTFEIPACGSFMLAERSYKHEEFFEDGKEAVFFDSNEDLLAKVKHYLRHPEERKLIAKAGYQQCINSNYDHASRLRKFLEIIEEELNIKELVST